MSLKTEELLGTYSTKQLAIYLRFNNFIELAETVERLELHGKHLRNCCRSSTGQEQQREEEVGLFNVGNDERIVLEVCELFGCTAEEAKRMCEELVKDFADVPWDETNPSSPEVKAMVGVPIGGGGGGEGRRVLRLEDRGGDTVGGALMREVPPDGYRNPRFPSWYDKSPTNDRWRGGLSRTEYYDDEEEGEEQNDRERRLRERERKVEEREKRMDEIEARLKRLEENGGTTAPSA
jgi:hypothetical protein